MSDISDTAYKLPPSPATYEEIVENISKLLSTSAALPNDAAVRNVQALLSLILARHLDTVDSVNYLRSRVRNAGFIKRINRIDANLKQIHNMYHLTLQHITDSHRRDIGKMNKAIVRFQKSQPGGGSIPKKQKRNFIKKLIFPVYSQHRK